MYIMRHRLRKTARLLVRDARLVSLLDTPIDAWSKPWPDGPTRWLWSAHDFVAGEGLDAVKRTFLIDFTDACRVVRDFPVRAGPSTDAIITTAVARAGQEHPVWCVCFRPSLLRPRPS